MSRTTLSGMSEKACLAASGPRCMSDTSQRACAGWDGPGKGTAVGWTVQPTLWSPSTARHSVILIH